jgi:hypothetical protein
MGLYPVYDYKDSETKDTKNAQVRSIVPTKDERKVSVRPKVADLINKVIKENAPTWQELAKR